ncbi:MAG: hypothetical protein WC943_09850 [Elusimicrobiota bacterium]|jgi:hypothetical protein
MELYGRFIVTLAFGLLGLGLVLQVLLDQVLGDWDVVADTREGVRRFMRGSLRAQRRTEDVLLDVDKSRPKELSTRLSTTSRLEPSAVIVKQELPPIPPPSQTGIRIAATARNPIYDEEWG